MVWLASDTFAADPVWEVLATDSAGRVDYARLDRLQATWARLASTAAHLRSRGYLTAGQALEQCRGRRQVLTLLTRAVLERPARLHEPTHQCPCLDEPWIAGYAYRLHRFSARWDT